MSELRELVWNGARAADAEVTARAPNIHRGMHTLKFSGHPDLDLPVDDMLPAWARHAHAQGKFGGRRPLLR